MLLLICFSSTTRSTAQEPKLAGRAGALGPLASRFDIAESSSALTNSFGLFIGIREYEEGFDSIPTAVEDAVAMATYFTRTLPMIPPNRVRLVVEGEPLTEEGRRNLEDLRKRGAVVVTNAMLGQIERELRRMPSAGVATPILNGLTVVFVSAHGKLSPEGPVIIPSSGETPLKVTALRAALERSMFDKRLLIVDACQNRSERPADESVAKGDERMPGQFIDALRGTAGLGVVFSCSSNQVSWSSPKLNRSVFTDAFLRGLQGGASFTGPGLVVLSNAVAYAQKEVGRWTQENGKAAQTPVATGALDLPLGFNQTGWEAAEREKQERAVKLDQAKQLLTDAKKKWPEVLGPEKAGEIEGRLNRLNPCPDVQSTLVGSIHDYFSRGLKSKAVEFLVVYKELYANLDCSDAPPPPPPPIPPPDNPFIAHPANTRVELDRPARLEARVRDEQRFAFQWQFRTSADGEWKNMAGQSNLTLSFPEVGKEDLGYYQLVARDLGTGRSYSSRTATLYADFEWSQMPKDINATLGGQGAVRFTGAVNQTLPDVPNRYQWEFLRHRTTRWTKLEGATTPVLELRTASYSDCGKYRLRVTGFATNTVSAEATLRISPRFNNEPKDLTVWEGEPIRVTGSAEGVEPLRYKWSRVNGARTTTVSAEGSFQKESAERSDSGEYRLTITDDMGSETASARFTITVKPVPVPVCPQSLSIREGETARFSAGESSDQLEYDWQRLDSNTFQWVTVGRSATLEIRNAKLANAGRYQLSVRNKRTDKTTQCEPVDLAIRSPYLEFSIQSGGGIFFFRVEGNALVDITGGRHIAVGSYSVGRVNDTVGMIQFSPQTGGARYFVNTAGSVIATPFVPAMGFYQYTIVGSVTNWP